MSIDINGIYNPINFKTTSRVGVLGTDDLIANYRLKLRPSLGSLWSGKTQSWYVGSVLSGTQHPTPYPVVINLHDSNKGFIDGRERLLALRLWAQGSIEALMPDGTSIHIDDLNDTEPLKDFIGVKYALVYLPEDEADALNERINHGRV